MLRSGGGDEAGIGLVALATDDWFEAGAGGGRGNVPFDCGFMKEERRNGMP